jgi:hypothetical protein
MLPWPFSAVAPQGIPGQKTCQGLASPALPLHRLIDNGGLHAPSLDVQDIRRGPALRKNDFLFTILHNLLENSRVRCERSRTPFERSPHPEFDRSADIAAHYHDSQLVFPPSTTHLPSARGNLRQRPPIIRQTRQHRPIQKKYARLRGFVNKKCAVFSANSWTAPMAPNPRATAGENQTDIS